MAKKVRRRIIKKLTYTFILIFLIISIGFVGYISRQKLSRENTEMKQKTEAEQIATFTESIKNTSSQQAYQDLKNNSRDISFSVQHTLAHTFGKALYRAEKDKGITICDNDLSFGCYHGFIIEAIKNKGISAVIELDSYCYQAGEHIYHGCQHGIGHGLVEHFGHKDILASLQQCELIQKRLLVGCSSGVFMEYFFPSSSITDTNTFLFIDPNDPFKPCDSIPSKFKQSCIFELPRLWKISKKNISTLIDRCSNLNNPNLQKVCFRGLGTATGSPSNLDPQFSLEVCNTIQEKMDRLYCLSGATWFYATIEASPRTIQAEEILCKQSINTDLCYRLSELYVEYI